MIYVMSDIHGHLPRYKDILRQIRLQKNDHLYVLGDCIDRNPNGIPILCALLRKPNVTVLLGNHEHMMMEALTKEDEDSRYLRRWYRNGGEVTHNHLKHCTKAFRARLLEQIAALPVNLEMTCNGISYLLVHGAPLGFRRKYDDEIMDAVWARLERDSQMPEGKVVIFGHTPTSHYQDNEPLEVYCGKRMIGIDCGCAYEEGRLACIRLDDLKVFYSADDV